MRKGFTLIEMLVVIIIIPILMLTFSGLFHTLIVSIPLTWKTVQQNTVTLDILSQMQKDMDEAVSLPQSYDKFISNDKSLLIANADSVICYQLEDGKITRLLFKNNQQSLPTEERTWKIPNTKINWLIHKINDKNIALEVQSHIEQKISGRTENKMAISHLFLVGVF
jgi:prepilin-type N-terminal cleavage/methylation domain-containing protein